MNHSVRGWFNQYVSNHRIARLQVSLNEQKIHINCTRLRANLSVNKMTIKEVGTELLWLLNMNLNNDCKAVMIKDVF